MISNNFFEEIREKVDAVRDIELGTLLQCFGSIKDHQDRAKWHTRQGIIFLNGSKFMNLPRGTGGGGAINLLIYLIYLQGIGFKDAVLWLYNHFSSSFVQKTCPINSYPAKQRLKLPQKECKKLPQVMRYLIKSRCLPEEFIKNVREMALCESAVDAVSCAVLYPEYTGISTSGATANRVWLQKFIANGCKIYCGFDADETGDIMANKMIEQYPSIKRLRPPKHDWNEVLQSIAS